MKKSSLILYTTAGLLIASCSSFALNVVNNSSATLYAWSGIKYQENALALPAGKSTPVEDSLLGTDPQHEYLNLATDTHGTPATVCSNLSPKYPGSFKLDKNPSDELIINADNSCTYKASTGPAPSNHVVAPYRQVNVGENIAGTDLSTLLPANQYVADLDKNHRPTATTVKFADNTPSIIKQYFNLDKYGNLKLAQNIEYQVDKKTGKVSGPLDSVCKDYSKGQKLCTFTLVNASDAKKTVDVNIILNSSIYTKSVLELTKESTAQQKDLLQVPGTDGSVDLSQYFTIPTGGNNEVTYQLDAEKVNGNPTHQADPSIVEIKKLGDATPKKGTPTNVAGFSIQGHTLTFGQMDSAIYQISIKATDANGNSAFETFYVNNLNEADKANFFKVGGHDFSMAYTYTNDDPHKAPDVFASTMGTYGNDIAHANKSDLGQHPVTIVAAEFGGPQYADTTLPFWKIDPKNQNLKQQIQSSAISNSYTDVSWVPTKLIKPIQDAAGTGVTVAPDLTFGNNVRASVSTFNQEQLGYTVDAMMKYVQATPTSNIYPGITGLSLDLEHGSDASSDNIFKTVSDRLAYHGLFFGFFEFGDKSFSPDNLAAMGPLGVSLISTYDATAKRSVKGFNQEDTALLTDPRGGMFVTDHSCEVPKGTDIDVASYCNQSINDTLAANQYQWGVMTQHKNSNKSPVDLFNAHYSPVLPIGGSATNWQGIEIWNPDLKAIAATSAVEAGSGAFILTNTPGGATNNASACDQIQSYSKDDAGLQACLFANRANYLSDGKPAISFGSCGNGVPLNKCLYVSALPGAVNGSVIHATQADYIKATAQTYNVKDPHFIGFSLFALQNEEAGSKSAYGLSSTPNSTVTEPWYVGWNASDSKMDPFYAGYKDKLDGLWKSVADAYNQAN